MKIKHVAIFALALSILVITVIPALAAQPFGELYYQGDVVRTIVPPAKMTMEGKDNLYVVFDDSGNILQRGIAAVAPGDRNYHGGKWAFHRVTWNIAPTGDLTSEAEVLQAAMAGNVTITRIPDNDFKCPIQP